MVTHLIFVMWLWSRSCHHLPFYRWGNWGTEKLSWLARSCSKWAGCPRKLILAWRCAFCNWRRECSPYQHPGAEKEAGLAEGKVWLCVMQLQQLHATPGGALEQRWPCPVFQNWDEGHGPFYYASCPWKEVVTLGESALFRRRQFLEGSLLAPLPTTGE